MIMAEECEISAGGEALSAGGQLEAFNTALVMTLRSVIPAIVSGEGAVNNAGLMLANGCKCYQDEGNRVEVATPEATDPVQAIAYRRAGELMLLSVLPQAARSLGLSPQKISLLRCATDYHGMFCGNHQNFSVQNVFANDLVLFLVSFLVSRFFSNAGGFGPKGFVMSHKNQAIKCVASNDTRVNRSILDQRNEHLSNCSRRIHICIGDHLMSDIGIYLTLGATAIVIKMLDDGACVGPAVVLEKPVEALHSLDCDLEWKKPLPLANGLSASALDIQEHYLRCAEEYCKKVSEPWMDRVLKTWRWAVDSLRHDPAQLEDSLDPFIKRKFFRGYLAKRGIRFEDLQKLIPSLWQLRSVSNSGSPKTRSVREWYRSRLPQVTFELIGESFSRNNVPWSQVPRLLGLLEELVALDLRYHEIDPEAGLYWRLRSCGIVNSKLVTDVDIHRARSSPPKGTRAEIRAKKIRELHKDPSARATWTYVTAGNGIFEFNDPNQTTANFRDLGRNVPGRNRRNP